MESKLDTSREFLESFGLNSGTIDLDNNSFCLMLAYHGWDRISSTPLVEPSLSFGFFYKHLLMKSLHSSLIAIPCFLASGKNTGLVLIKSYIF